MFHRLSESGTDEAAEAVGVRFADGRSRDAYAPVHHKSVPEHATSLVDQEGI